MHRLDKRIKRHNDDEQRFQKQSFKLYNKIIIVCPSIRALQEVSGNDLKIVFVLLALPLTRAGVRVYAQIVLCMRVCCMIVCVCVFFFQLPNGNTTTESAVVHY